MVYRCAMWPSHCAGTHFQKDPVLSLMLCCCLKFSVILSLNSCFVSEVHWDSGACTGAAELRVAAVRIQAQACRHNSRDNLTWHSSALYVPSRDQISKGNCDPGNRGRQEWLPVPAEKGRTARGPLPVSPWSPSLRDGHRR